MIRQFVVAALTFGSIAIANGQPAPVTDVTNAQFDPENAVAPNSTEIEGDGLKVGEGTVLHPTFGVETGYISNVFYTQSNPTGAALIRVLAQIGSASLSQSRLTSPNSEGQTETNKGELQYNFSARLGYDIMLSSDKNVSATDGLNAGLSLHGMANPMGTVSFGFDEDFTRLIRAANYETDADTNRDINVLRLAMNIHPAGRTVSGFLYYQNVVDVFEKDSEQFANRWDNSVGIHPQWQWLPQTQLYADVSQGIDAGLGTSSTKVTSYPLTAKAGLATLLNLNTTVNLEGGYTNGFYSSGPSYSGPVVGAQLGYRYSPLGRITLLYNWQYQDSINANFYRDHIIQLSVRQMVDPVTFVVQPEIRFRNYSGITIVDGPPQRDDIIVSVLAGVHYSFKNWLSATLDYRFSTVQTDYRYMPLGGGTLDDPSYVRHELLLGLRAAL